MSIFIRTDENGRRVAAFGFYAGYAGTALALISWAHQVLNPGVTQGPVPTFDNAEALRDYVKSSLDPAIQANGGQKPRVIVIGALGRCGSGAVKFCREAGLPDESIVKWDMAETAVGGPFAEIPAVSHLLQVEIQCHFFVRNSPLTYLGLVRCLCQLRISWLDTCAPLRHLRLPQPCRQASPRHLRRQLRPQQRQQPHPRLLHVDLFR